jgi:hypothetical protein
MEGASGASPRSGGGAVALASRGGKAPVNRSEHAEGGGGSGREASRGAKAPRDQGVQEMDNPLAGRRRFGVPRGTQKASRER